MTSVREHVKNAQAQMLQDLSPVQARELLVKLTSLLGNVLSECTAADHAYAIVLLRFLDADEAANRAKIRAETSQEYLRKQEASTTKQLIVEAIRSLKSYITSVSEEMRLTR